MAQPPPVDPVSALLSDFSTRLNEIEEKQRLVKDRILLVGENLVSTKETYDRDILDFKKQLTEINQEIKALKNMNKRIVEELENYARKSELEILERQFKMFEPIEFARIKDVKMMIEEELNKKTHNKK
jgi:hypothetical protein